ncbi:hypothetical protein MMP61_18620 [Acinetobacter sp. NIPH 1958]|uniref:hypothetical protein n=1 Tax=Acinetobacter sp. NIPH 1958 TaxID=2923430 RepID=UPI001F4BB0BD|nr:hypothetical protein [Acinetobacter sp. NIPH 1958]MCH7357553.1 hypothetical protein [Acinetobacter sp. NIPH 1958]
MNAIQFIQQHGFERAREELTKLPNSNVTHMTDDARMFVDENNPLLDEFQRSQIKDLICINDLKRLVKSIDTVNSFGGLEDSKAVVKMGKYYKYLKKAIADYEAIGGEHV